MTDADSGQFGWNTETDWALLHLAHAAIPEESRRVWSRLLMQYQEPVRRSLRGMVRDADAVEELYQEFWHRFLRGDFARATPERGRFRNLLRTALYHLVADHYRAAKRRGVGLDADVAGGDPPAEDQFAAAHAAYWRGELLERALRTLAAEDAADGTAYAAVLGEEVGRPERPSAEKAAGLAARLGRPVSADNYRQLLHRARRRFAAVLVEEVRQSLTDPTPELVREELAELDLLRYCETAVDPG